MKTVDTLIADIHSFIESPDYTNEHSFAQELANILQQRLGANDTAVQGSPTRGALRFSNVGTNCDRKLWYHVNRTELSEPLHPNTRIKFLYGDILEALLLELAQCAGHTVTGTQTELVVGGIKGHRDAVIDGMVVDCKSASTYSFNKFKSHLRPEDDAFGYLWQLRSYLYASRSDPSVTEKIRAAFFVIDKTTGALFLDIHEFTDEELDQVPNHIERQKGVVSAKEVPERGYTDVEWGKSGNRGLDVYCSYCPFKMVCWPGLKVYGYSNGPAFLTEVKREPNVPLIGEAF
jgi:hypothetical protein